VRTRIEGRRVWSSLIWDYGKTRGGWNAGLWKTSWRTQGEPLKKIEAVRMEAWGRKGVKKSPGLVVM